jgi:hypothetical protein
MKDARTLSKSVWLRFRSLPTLVAVLALLLVVTLPQDSFARTTKKKKYSVTVEQDANCPFGVSASEESWGDRRLCVPNYPGGAAGLVSAHIGEKIELEADFMFSGDPKSTEPDAITRVTKVSGHKVYDPCSTGNAIMWGALAGMGSVPATLPPGCQESIDASTQTTTQ